MRIVFQGKTKTGKDIIIRYLDSEDTPRLLQYINEISREKTFITFQGEQLTLSEEEQYVSAILKKVAEKRAVELVVIYENEIIGIAGISLGEKVESHHGVFGITIAKGYRGDGIGSILMKLTLDEAQMNLPELRLVILKVYEGNSLAKNMYERFGFKNYGNLPEGIHYKGNYIGVDLMYKKVK
ncbi:MAG TPA: GNAT family N-acetyltransferase [Patescibacteria group bacterium]|nr:GNAT family N-acetyltransferase [Patescibacteria group bacterium]